MSYLIIVYLFLSGELFDPLIPLNSILFHIFVGNLGVGVLHELHVFVGGLWVGIDLELFGLDDDLDVETGQEFFWCHFWEWGQSSVPWGYSRSRGGTG